MTPRASQCTVPAATTPTMLGGLGETVAWQGVMALFADMMSAFSKIPFVAEAGASATEEPFVAEITLSNLDVELTLAVVVDRRALRPLALAMLETADDDLGRSLVLEAGNVLMGSLRSVLAAEGHRARLGLPVAVPIAGSDAAFARAPLAVKGRLRSTIATVDLALRASPPTCAG